jgi:hypothetical protein
MNTALIAMSTLKFLMFFVIIMVFLLFSNEFSIFWFICLVAMMFLTWICCRSFAHISDVLSTWVLSESPAFKRQRRTVIKETKKINTQIGKILKSASGENIQIVRDDMIGSNVRCDRYPTSFLLKKVVLPLLPVAARVEILKLRRVAPTAINKAKHLASFKRAAGSTTAETLTKFKAGLREMDKVYGLDTLDFRMKYVASLRSPWEEVPIDPSSSAGYPFRPGVKKSDVHEEARAMATYELEHGCPSLRRDFIADAHPIYDDAYLKRRHTWYTGGRGKIKSIFEKDSARVIQFGGYAQHLIAAKFIAPVAAKIRDEEGMSAIGVSWFYGGCDRFYKTIMKALSKFGHFFLFWSIDIAGWDASLKQDLLIAVKDWYLERHRACASLLSRDEFIMWEEAIEHTFSDLCDRDVHFLNWLLRIEGGMPSGFSGTADVNTQIHEAMIRGAKISNIHKAVVKVYGDDNFGGAIDEDGEQILEEMQTMYGDYGLKVKHLHRGCNPSDVDFLSVTPKYDVKTDMYYPTRDKIDTLAKLIYPDESFVDDSPMRRAACIIGTLALVWRQKETREPLFEALRILCERHHISLVPAEALRLGRFSLREIGWKDLTIEEVPEFMESLHHPRREFGLDYETVNAMEYTNSWTPNKEAPEASFGKAADDAGAGLSDIRSRLSDAVDMAVKRLVAPFTYLRHLKGHAGAKSLGMIEKCFSWFNNFTSKDIICVIGAHPGSGVVGLKTAFPHNPFRIISARSRFDQSPFLCKAISLLSRRDIVVEGDFVPSMAKGFFGLVDIDVAYGREHGEDLDYSRFRLRSVERHFDLISPMIESFRSRAKVIFVKVIGLSESFIPTLYQWYCYSEDFKLEKLRYSYPWNVEYHIGLLNYSTRRRGACISLGKFKRTIYFFWNHRASERLAWNMLRQRSLRLGHKHVAKNPVQDDEYKQKEFLCEISNAPVVTSTSFKDDICADAYQTVTQFQTFKEWCSHLFGDEGEPFKYGFGGNVYADMAARKQFMICELDLDPKDGPYVRDLMRLYGEGDFRSFSVESLQQIASRYNMIVEVLSRGPLGAFVARVVPSTMSQSSPIPETRFSYPICPHSWRIVRFLRDMMGGSIEHIIFVGYVELDVLLNVEAVTKTLYTGDRVLAATANIFAYAERNITVLDELQPGFVGSRHPVFFELGVNHSREAGIESILKFTPNRFFVSFGNVDGLKDRLVNCFPNHDYILSRPTNILYFYKSVNH